MNVTRKMAGRCQNVREHRPAVIACLGDSVTHGCFELVRYPDGHWQSTCRPEEGYAARLQRRLRNFFPLAAPTVYNAGIGGDNAGGGLERLERDVLSIQPDLVIVNFALNDSCDGNVERGLAAYTEHMAGIFDRVLETGAECMLLTPNRMCAYVSEGIETEALKKTAEHCAHVQNEGILTRYVETARALAQARSMPVADAYARWQALEQGGVDTTALLSNRINHPVMDMHDVFVDAIIGKLFE